ncbi:MAG: DUF177 domain-containing protein, partial [Myxococcota bacterium]
EEWVNESLGEKSPFVAANPGRLKVHLERRRAGVVQARGTLQVSLRADCARCLYPVEVTLNQGLDLVLFPLGSEPQAGPDGELGAEDMGVATYTDGEVDLTSLVRDEIFLEMPMNPTCDFNDPRDCDHFMANLGKYDKELQVGENAPEEKPVDPRWAALNRLKN